MSRPGTETVSARYADLDMWDTGGVLHSLWESQMAAVAAVRPALAAIEAAVDAAAQRLGAGNGRLVYAGAGTSGRIGVQDGAELPPTFDWPQNRLVLLMAGGLDALVQAVENAEDSHDQGQADIRRHAIGPDDVVIGVAASGTTPFTIGCVEEARARGALTIGVANNPNAPLLAASEHPILAETGPEAVAGSTRLKAGTAQKIILNLISTALMVRLNRVYGGQMVDMQARNAKLRRRALRMVTSLAPCDEAEAQRALDAAGGKVKLALLLVKGHTREQAEALLTRHGGSLRAADAEQPCKNRNATNPGS